MISFQKANPGHAQVESTFCMIEKQKFQLLIISCLHFDPINLILLHQTKIRQMSLT